MKAKAHVQYKNKEGKRIPGVTTITGILNKPALVKWANNLGLQGIDSSKYVDDKAAIGTLCHKMVEDYINGKETDFSDYTPNQKSQAENGFIKFLDWEKENDFKCLDSELQLVSEAHQYGGTCDIYAMLNGKLTLIDIKTSKACYDDQYTQVVAYQYLLIENKKDVEDTRILRIGRDEIEGFDDIKVPAIDLHWERFKSCREIYEINKQLRRGV
jgi:hypothetical protein